MNSSPRRAAVCRTHASGPNGRPRCTQVRMPSSCSSLSPRLTHATQFRDRSTGHGLNRRSAAPCARRHSPHHCHSSARSTSPARSAIGLHVPAQRHEVIVLRHGKTLETSLIEMPPAAAGARGSGERASRPSNPSIAPTPRRSAAGQRGANGSASGSRSAGPPRSVPGPPPTRARTPRNPLPCEKSASARSRD